MKSIIFCMISIILGLFRTEVGLFGRRYDDPIRQEQERYRAAFEPDIWAVSLPALCFQACL